MESGVFGRTNQVFPAKWLRLVATHNDDSNLENLVTAALRANTVIDISSSPALWGGFLRGTDATLMGVGPLDLSTATGEQHAHDLVLAHLIETLSGIGREHLDFYFLLIDRHLQESQISGALIALEEARQEGNVRFSGLAARDAFAAQSLLHFHDAFEAMLLDAEHTSVNAGLRGLARSRRVALVTQTSQLGFEPGNGEAALYCVGTTADIDKVLQSKAVA